MNKGYYVLNNIVIVNNLFWFIFDVLIEKGVVVIFSFCF